MDYAARALRWRKWADFITYVALGVIAIGWSADAMGHISTFRTFSR